MTQRVPGCAICNVLSCECCQKEKHQIGLVTTEQDLYTWHKDAALCKDAALPGLTMAEPEHLQPLRLANAAPATTDTTLEPYPTHDPVGSDEGLQCVTPQSLNENSLHRVRETRVPPTVKPPTELELSSLSLSQVDTIGLPTDPSHWTSPLPRQVVDSPYPLQHQDCSVEQLLAAFNKWKAQGNKKANGSSSRNSTGPPSNSESNQSTSPGSSRKRTSGRGSKQGSAKRPKVSNDQLPQARKENKHLLACPFYKKDPVMHRNCFKGVKRIRDVKQHLKRRHRQPIFCWRCGMEFGKEKERLREHARAADQCAIRGFQDPDGITPQHEEALNRYSDRSTNEARQWYVIWDYCFPGGPNGKPPPERPSSPYVDEGLCEELSSFLEFCRRDAWRILATCDNPDVNQAAFNIAEETLHTVFDVLREGWSAERVAFSQSSREESLRAPSESSTPDDKEPASETTPIDDQQREDTIMELSEFPEDLDFENNFFDPQIDGFWDEFMSMPSVDNDTAETFPSVPLLSSDLVLEHAIPVATLDPSLISR